MKSKKLQEDLFLMKPVEEPGHKVEGRCFQENLVRLILRYYFEKMLLPK